MKKGLTEVVLVLDRSGSMHTTKDDAEGGLRNFVKAQRAVPGECRLTFYRFDDAIERVFDNKLLSEVSDSELVLEPRGMTALLDAMGRAIDEVGIRLAATPEDQRPERVFFVTITDGHENYSRHFTKNQVMTMVTRQRDQYSWVFHFIGSNLDAIAMASQVGILPQYTLTYSGTKIGTVNSYGALAQNISKSRETGQVMCYTPEDRTNAAEQ